MDIIKAATVKEKKIMMEDDPLRLPIFCIMLQAFILCFVLIVLAPFHKKLPVTIVPEWSIRFLALIRNASYLQLDEIKLHAKTLQSLYSASRGTGNINEITNIDNPVV